MERKLTINRRAYVQATAALTFVVLWAFTASPLKSAVPTNLWLRADPLLALGNALAVRRLAVLFWPAALLLLLAAWKGRVFCAWGCPVGALLDLESWILRRLGYRGYWRTASFPKLGPWLALGALLASFFGVGAVVGFLDPLIFAHRGLTFLRAGLLPEMLLLVLGLGLIAPRFWCRHLCPLGGLLGHADLRRFRAKPAQNAGAGTQRQVRSDPGYSRRDFLLLATGAVLAGGSAQAAGGAFPGAAKPFLRPPGALSEPGLTAACVRCGECLKVCPTRGLLPALTEAG
ncbi:MAG: 4Fe-4S binding protein, partial [Methanocella sp.]